MKGVLVIKKIGDYFCARGSQVVPGVGLVHHSDNSIRFTNSSTSVMKDLIVHAEKYFGKTFFLAQPAMGAQGIINRMNHNKIGRYSSYFISLGNIYFSDDVEEAFEDLVGIVNLLHFDIDVLAIRVHCKDDDLIAACRRTGIAVILDDTISRFRHRYGLEGIVGRNIILSMSYHPQQYELCYISVIEKFRRAICVELATDSTQITAGLNNFDHAIYSLPGAPCINREKAFFVLRENEKRAYIDSAAILFMLMYEGLQPISRGRGGILRKFFKEIVHISKKYNIDRTIVRDSIINSGVLTLNELRGGNEYFIISPKTVKNVQEKFEYWFEKLFLSEGA